MKFPVFALVLATAVLASTPLSSRAASIAKVHEFTEVTGGRKMMENMLPGMVTIIINGLKQNHPNLTPDMIDVATKVVIEIMTPLLPQMQSANEKLYADAFTDDELSAAISFYRTPAGQSMLQKLPVVAQQAMQSGQTIVAAHIPELKERLIEELKKKYPDMK